MFGGRGQKNSLFINEGQGRFVDRSGEFLPKEKCTARGGDVADINGDGYPDVVLACMRPTMLGGPAPNRLYMNKGKQAPGRFVNASHLLPPNNARSTDAAFCDVDGDGRFDIVFANEVDLLKGRGGEDNLVHMKQDGSFEDWSNRLPKINRITWEVRILDFNRDKAPDIFSNRAYFNYDAGYGPKAEHGRHLLQGNDGKGSFSLPTVRQFDYIDQELHSWCGSCVGDLNEDGYPEIVQAVDGQVRIHQTFLRTKAVAHPVYAEIRRGQAIQFDASSTHFPWGLKAKSVGWQFGDGKKASGQTVSHKYTTGGKYTVTLKVTDTAGYTDMDRVTVIVK
jgi:hypothetical protein